MTSARDEGKVRLLHAVDPVTGKLLWTAECKQDQPEKTSAVTGHAAATPVTDGERVLAAFGNAGIVAYDFTGKRLWHHAVEGFDTELGLATSPILYRGMVLWTCDHDGDRFTSFDSYLLALDVRTGKVVWKTARPGVGRSWSTPLVVRTAQGTDELIIPAESQLRGYDPTTGKELWHLTGLTPWITPSPVGASGMVYAVSGKNGPVLAVKAGGRGAVKPVWMKQTGGPYVSSPLLYGDYLYTGDEHGWLTCYEARTGKRIYRERHQAKFTSSPVAGEEKLYFTSESGETYVVAAGPRYRLLAKNALGEEVLASLVFSESNLLIRGSRHLYCIQTPSR